MSQVELRGVTKRFGAFTAVDGIDLHVPAGEIFGLLGPNGAGKTTTIRMMMNIFHPDSGEILFNGRPLREADKQRIGYLPEERGLYKKMRVDEQLIYLARLKGLEAATARSRTAQFLERLELGEWAGRRVEDLSKGMAQKVQFAAALLHEPELVILDEPFSGLDPLNIQLLTEWIHELRRRGVTVIFSAHQLDAVERLCQAIALIYRGRVLIEGELAEIKAARRTNVWRLEFEGNVGFAPAGKGVVAARRKPGGYWLVQLEPDNDGRPLLRRALLEGPIRKFERLEPTLQELFVQLVREAGMKPPEPEEIAAVPEGVPGGGAGAEETGHQERGPEAIDLATNPQRDNGGSSHTREEL